MRICHIVPHIDEQASGPAYSVPRLTEAIASHGHNVTLATLARGRNKRSLDVQHMAFKQAAFPQRLGRSPTMKRWLLNAGAGGVELLHSHGLWMMPNIYASKVMQKRGLAHVVAPRGTLDPAALSYSRIVKTVMWNFGQGAALRQASAIHATSELEIDHIRRLGLRAPILLSPNGIDVPKLDRPCRSKQRTLLYLGRLHEKKGLDMLLNAWTRIEPIHRDWNLRIVGKGSATFEKNINHQIQTSNFERVTVESALYDEEKLDAYRSADLFILPSRGENFGMVVAEALAAGTPVITTTRTPWIGLTDHLAGWCCSADVASIETALIEALGVPPGMLEEMGGRGRSWMADSYGWEKIAGELAEAYRWLLSGGSCPSIVSLA